MSSRSTGVDGVRVGAIARILCVTKYAVKSAAAAWRERGEEVKEAHAGANGGCATGVLHSLLGIDSAKALLSNPRCGASWEGLIIEEILSRTMHTEAYWWSTHQGVEIDLVLFHKGKRFGVEVKRTDAPTITPSIRIAQETLGLTRVSVVTPGDRSYDLSKHVRVIAITASARATYADCFSRGRCTSRASNCSR